MKNRSRQLISWTVVLMVAVGSLQGQSSLWRGVNPYKDNYLSGQILKVEVSEFFEIKVSGDWARNFEVDLKVDPDPKNTPFLQSSEESRDNHRKWKERQNVKEEFIFSINGIITVRADGLFDINATRDIQIDGKQTSVRLSGVINPGDIRNGVIKSDRIANLNLVIISKPVIERDQNYTITPPPQNEGEEGTNGNPAVTPELFTQEQKNRYIIEHIREILGGLQ